MAYEQGWTTPAYFCESASQVSCPSASTDGFQLRLMCTWLPGAFYPTVEHGMLVNHQVVAPGGGTIGGDYIAPLKAVHIDRAAELRLTYWKGNDALKGTLRKAGTATEALNGSLGFVVEGNIQLPLGGEISLCPCNSSPAAGNELGESNGCSTTGGSSVKVNGTDLTMQLCKAGNCIEHIDRGLTPSLLSGTDRAGSGSSNFTLLQRRGMWEFYLSGFLALPERMAAAHECLTIHGTAGVVVDSVWDMTAMPLEKPVAIAPTWKKPGDEDSA